MALGAPLGACVAQTPAVAPPRESASGPAVVLAVSSPPVASSVAPVTSSGPVASASVAPAVASAPLRLEIEPVYLATAYAYPAGAAERRERLVELERWNNGGLGDGEKWHPQPRVVIEEPVVSGRGKQDTRAMMRHLRAEQYGVVRRCYDAALRQDPELGGRVVMRISLSKAGVITTASAQGARGVPDHRKHRTALGSADVGRCIASGLRGAHVGGARGGTFAFSIDVYPGDAPMPDLDTQPSPSRLDTAAADRVARSLAPSLDACFVAGRASQPGLWGRLALRLDVDARGAVQDAREVDSTFPSGSVRECAAGVLRQATWPAPDGDRARLVVALRWPP